MYRSTVQYCISLRMRLEGVGWTELTQDGGPVSIFCLHGDGIVGIGNALGLQQ
jgi:hypothetical protein